MSIVEAGLSSVSENARSEYHASLLRISPELLATVLRLPPGVQIVDVRRGEFPNDRHVFLVLVGAGLPAVQPGEIARQVDATYQTDPDGTVRLLSITEPALLTNQTSLPLAREQPNLPTREALAVEAVEAIDQAVAAEVLSIGQQMRLDEIYIDGRPPTDAELQHLPCPGCGTPFHLDRAALERTRERARRG